MALKSKLNTEEVLAEAEGEAGGPGLAPRDPGSGAVGSGTLELGDAMSTGEAAPDEAGARAEGDRTRARARARPRI